MQEEILKDLGEAKKILGINIQRNRKKQEIFISQEKYIDKVLEKFKMSDARSVVTPLAPHFKLSAAQCPKDQQEIEDMAKVPYANAVGCIMYLMVCTRPDIAHAVSVVSRYMSNPGKIHWEALKWILRYLKGTKDVGLLYKRGKFNSECLRGYVDADYGGDRDKKKSLSGYIFTAWGNAISWKAKLQSVVALSTTEAEYVAATAATKEALWLKGIVNELGIDQHQVIVNCDNQSAVFLAKNQAYSENLKHIGMRIHFIRDMIEQGEVDLKKIAGAENPADMLTKSVSTDKLRLCMSLTKVLKN